ncbi:MAG: Ig-like domain-containing protein, partial [Cyanobacteria bacterium J06598_3]
GQFESLTGGQSTTDSFTYTVDDGNGGTDTATVSITINGANDSPVVAASLAETTDEDAAAFTLDLLAGASDPEGDPLGVNASSFAITSGDGTGLSLNGNTLEIDPSVYGALATGEQEIVTVSYDIEDGNGGSVTQTADITIEGINDDPEVAAPITAAGNEENAPFVVDLLTGATDTEGQDLSVASLSLSSGNGGGITDNGDGTLSVDPSAYSDLGTGESEVVEYAYTVTDTQGGTVSQTATVTITGTNNQPVAVNISVNATEDSPAVTTAFDANDADLVDDGNLTFSILDQPVEGTVFLDPADDTQFIFDPGTSFQDLAEGETRDVSFTYTAADGQGLSNSVSEPATVTITVTGVNDDPEASDDGGTEFTTDEATTFTTGNVLTNDTDIDGDTLSVLSIDATSTQGLVTDNGDGTFSYSPNGQFDALTTGDSVTDSFTYTVDDGNGGTDTATVSITINGENNNPVVTGPVTSTTDEESGSFSLDLLSGTSDPEGSTLSVDAASFTVVGGDDTGISLNGNSLEVTPTVYQSLESFEQETITVSYDIQDGNGGVVTQTAVITVNGQNDAPVLAGPVTAIGTESGAVIVANLFEGATDVEGQPLTISGLSLQSGDDAGVTDNGDGTLSIDPSFYGDLAFGESEVIRYSYTLQDTQAGVAVQTATITITGENNQPVAVDISIDADEDGAQVIEPFSATDPDTSDNATLTFAITAQPSEGTVSINPTNASEFVFDPGDDFQDLAVGETREVSFTYTADDGAGQANSVSEPATVTVTVTGENDAPVATLDEGAEFTTDESTPFTTGNVLDNDTDVDNGAVITVQSIDETGTQGIVTDNGNGTFSYNPNGQFDALAGGESATDSFTYTVDDGNGGTDTATVNITINGANNNPVVSAPVTSTTSEDAASFSVDLLENASDPEGDPLAVEAGSFVVTSGDATGISLNGNSLEVDPSAYNRLESGQQETVEVSYSIVDDNGGAVTQTAQIVIDGVNDAPVVSGSAIASGSESDAPFTLDLRDNVTDPEGQALTISGLTLQGGDDAGVTDNGDGTLTVNPSFYSDLSVGESEVLSYSYAVADTQAAIVFQTATITITGENNQPVAVDISIAATEDGTQVIQAFNATDGDLTDNANLIFNIASQPSEGSVTVDSANGTQFVFDPGTGFQDLAEGETRDVTFTYTANDGRGEDNSLSTPATVTVTVTGTNDNPVTTADDFTTEEGTPFTTGNVLGNDTDVDNGSVITVQGFDSSGTQGLVTDNGDGTFAYDPNGQFESLTNGETATDSFDYTVEDADGGSAVGTVTITINGANDAPVVVGPLTETASEDDAALNLDLLTGASDPEGSAIAVNADSFTVTSGNGTGLTLNNNSLNIDPNAYNALASGEQETIQVSYDIEDGNGGSTTQSATITINGVNDTPQITAPAAVTVTENDTPVTLDLLQGIVDPEGQPLTVSGITLASGDDKGVTDNGDGTFSIDPSLYSDLGVGESEVIEYTYSVADTQFGTAFHTAVITINGANDQPVAVDVAINADEDGATVTDSFSASDGDATDSLTFAIEAQPTEGSVSIDPVNNTQFTFDPGTDFQDLAAGETRDVTFTYTADDGQGEDNSISDPATVTVTVTGVNDDPVANNDDGTEFTTDEDTSFTTGNVLTNDTDADTTDVLSIQILDDSSTRGIVTSNGDGTFAYDPNGQFETLGGGDSDTDQFSYTIEDGNGGTSTATVTLTVNGANDAPIVAAPLAETTDE